MTLPADVPADNEARVLDGLRHRYERLGFTFTAEPDKAMVPAFLGDYSPDAIARKPGHNIAIEVKLREDAGIATKLASIRERFVGQSDWRFDVVYVNGDSQMSIPATMPGTIRDRLSEVADLNAQGHHRAAFVLAWSLLEAALQSLSGVKDNRPRPAGVVVQSLAMNGHISPKIERQLRASVDLRNRVVHGDLSVEPSAEDVDALLVAVREALTEPVA